MTDTPKDIVKQTNPVHNVIRNLSDTDFLEFGIQQVAYIRPVRINSDILYSIHAANGTPLSVMESHDSAIGAIRSNELEPITLH